MKHMSKPLRRLLAEQPEPEPEPTDDETAAFYSVMVEPDEDGAVYYFGGEEE